LPSIYKSHKAEAKNYLKASGKYEFPFYAIGLLYLVPFMLLWFSGRWVEAIFSNISLFIMLGGVIFFLPSLWMFAFSLQWFVRLLISAGRDRPLPAVNYCLARVRQTVFMFGALAFAVCFILGFIFEITSGGMTGAIWFAILILVMTIGFAFLLRWRINSGEGRTRGDNIGFYITGVVVMFIVAMVLTAIFSPNAPRRFDDVLSDGQPTITLRDLGIDTAPIPVYTRIRSSVAVPVNYEHWEGSEANVRTFVYRTVNRHLTRWLFEHRIVADWEMRQHIRIPNSKLMRLDSIEAAFWGADEGAVDVLNNGTINHLFLLKGKTIVRLHFWAIDNIDAEILREAVRDLIYAIEEGN
jgi:hypothetical protein